MGVRLYAPTLGRFLSVDPVPGGNDNPYVYPADPINSYDLDGKISWKKKFQRWMRQHQGAINFAIGLAATVAAGAAAAAICGATGGLGCFIIAGAMTRVAVGAVGRGAAAKAGGYRYRGRTALGYALGDAISGGFAGAFRGAMGRGTLGWAMKGRARGYGGWSSYKSRHFWAMR
jgi:hypothetical protein